MLFGADAERQALQNKANEDVKVMMVEQQKKLKQLAQETALKKRKLLKAAPSKRVRERPPVLHCTALETSSSPAAAS